MPLQPGAGKPANVRFYKGRWYWYPPARLRTSHKLTTRPLGADKAQAWAYAAVLNRDLLQLGPGSPVIGTVSWLLEAFLASDRFARLAPSTKRDYEGLARRVLGTARIGDKTLGERLALTIKPKHADAFYDEMKATHGHAYAHYACRFARRVWKWGGRRELVDQQNPWAGMELAGIPQRTARWKPEHVAAVRAAAEAEGRPSIGLAVLIAYSFGHRQADVLALTWAALDAGELRTGKTAAVVPVVAEAYPELAAALSTERARQVVVPSTHVLVCEATGKPWLADFFRHEFRRIARLAGLPAELQFRDLRATAMTELSDSGADVIAMSTHSGHRTVQMAKRYARPTGEQFRRAAEQRQRKK